MSKCYYYYDSVLRLREGLSMVVGSFEDDITLKMIGLFIDLKMIGFLNVNIIKSDL